MMFERYKVLKLNKQFGIKKRCFLLFYKWLIHNKIIIHKGVGYVSKEIQIFVTINDTVKKIRDLERR